MLPGDAAAGCSRPHLAVSGADAESKLPVEEQQVFPFLSEYSGVCRGFLPPACQYLPVAIERVQRINGQKNSKPPTKPTPWFFFVLFVFSIFQIV